MFTTFKAAAAMIIIEEAIENELSAYDIWCLTSSRWCGDGFGLLIAVTALTTIKILGADCLRR